ncbi:MAG: reverse transcriptase-like protein [Actinomycetota bacterium]|nr:reverse transcriptase-like protein [Actinomycetota bacterium]
MKATLHADGGARGNPGPAGIGVVLRDDSGRVVGELSEGIGEATNNVAEYNAVIEGLRLAHELGVTDIEIQLDSKLVVMQLSGEWKIKSDALRGLAVEARRLLNRFSSTKLTHVGREQNADADKLVNQALDASGDLGLLWEPDEDDDRPRPGPGQTSLL